MRTQDVHRTSMPRQSYDGHRINFWPKMCPWPWIQGHQNIQTLDYGQLDSHKDRWTRANLYTSPPTAVGDKRVSNPLLSTWALKGGKGFQTISLLTFVHLGFDGGHAGVISPGALWLEWREHPPHLVKLLVHLHEFLMHRMETLVTSGRN